MLIHLDLGISLRPTELANSTDKIVNGKTSLLAIKEFNLAVNPADIALKKTDHDDTFDHGYDLNLVRHNSKASERGLFFYTQKDGLDLNELHIHHIFEIELNTGLKASFNQFLKIEIMDKEFDAISTDGYFQYPYFAPEDVAEFFSEKYKTHQFEQKGWSDCGAGLSVSFDLESTESCIQEDLGSRCLYTRTAASEPNCIAFDVFQKLKVPSIEKLRFSKNSWLIREPIDHPEQTFLIGAKP